MFKPLKNFASLFFPVVCVACGEEETVHKKLFCHLCWREMPKFSEIAGNKDIFQKRFPLISDSSFYGLFLFTKSGLVQNVLHEIKYRNRKDVGFDLGKMLAKTINTKYDAIIPIPSHYKKERIRGYNQAEVIANGIGTILKVPTQSRFLKKVVNTVSQTKKDKISRRKDVLSAYEEDQPIPKEVKRILLVDDVVTTGATLEICTQLLKTKPEIEIDYAFIAMSV